MEYIGSSFINLLYKERASIALTLSSESSECFLENIFYSLFYNLDNFSKNRQYRETFMRCDEQHTLTACEVVPDKCHNVKWYNTIKYYMIRKKTPSDLLPDEKLLINTLIFFASIHRSD